MEYRRLGRSSLDVSAICLGCMNFGGRTEEDESVRIIHAALDAGVNFLDTANIYGRGRSERIVGRALAGEHRDRAVLATKVSGPMGDGPNQRGPSRRHIMEQAEQSLQRLSTDRIDLYQLHFFFTDIDLDETLRAMDDLVTQGKVLYTGCSKWAPSLITEAMLRCERNGWTGFVSEQPPYSLLDRRIENELTWVCRRFGIGIIPWAPIGAGILSGKYDMAGHAEGPSRFKEWTERLTPAAVEVADAIKPLADAKGVSQAELALAWVARQPGITAPIIGVRTMEHLESAIRCLDVEFSADDRARIDQIIPPGTAVSDYYDRNVHHKIRVSLGLEPEGD